MSDSSPALVNALAVVEPNASAVRHPCTGRLLDGAAAGHRGGRRGRGIGDVRVLHGAYPESAHAQGLRARVGAFCVWCEREGVALKRLTAPAVSRYLNGLPTWAASVKLTASALRHWLDFLTERGVLPFNPALSVRTARLVVTEGKTPVLEREEARALLVPWEALDAVSSTVGIKAHPRRGVGPKSPVFLVAREGFEPSTFGL
jgi:hypothetical protein